MRRQGHTPQKTANLCTCSAIANVSNALQLAAWLLDWLPAAWFMLPRLLLLSSGGKQIKGNTSTRRMVFRNTYVFTSMNVYVQPEPECFLFSFSYFFLFVFESLQTFKWAVIAGCFVRYRCAAGACNFTWLHTEKFHARLHKGHLLDILLLGWWNRVDMHKA